MNTTKTVQEMDRTELVYALAQYAHPTWYGSLLGWETYQLAELLRYYRGERDTIPANLPRVFRTKGIGDEVKRTVEVELVFRIERERIGPIGPTGAPGATGNAGSRGARLSLEQRARIMRMVEELKPRGYDQRRKKNPLVETPLWLLLIGYGIATLAMAYAITFLLQNIHIVITH